MTGKGVRQAGSYVSRPNAGELGEESGNPQRAAFSLGVRSWTPGVPMGVWPARRGSGSCFPWICMNPEWQDLPPRVLEMAHIHRVQMGCYLWSVSAARYSAVRHMSV